MTTKEEAQKYYNAKIAKLEAAIGDKEKVRLFRELRKLETKYAEHLSHLKNDNGRLPYQQEYSDMLDPKKNKNRKKMF